VNEDTLHRWFYLLGACLLTISISANVVGVQRARANSSRLGELQQRVDTVFAELAESQCRVTELTNELAAETRRSRELSAGISTGIVAIQTAIAAGTSSLADRIRAVATQVKKMEDDLNWYYNNSGGRNNLPSNQEIK